VADRHELAAVVVVTTAAAGSVVALAPATRSGPAVAARSLYRFFRAGEEETLALQGVSLEVGAGELVAIVGPSGSGKSTLLGCLAGLDEPDGGTVWIEARRMSHQPEPVRARLRAGRIGYVGQSANLFPHLTVEENLLLVRRLTGREAGGSITERLAAVRLADRARAYPAELSGGEAARAGLAVALAADEDVVLDLLLAATEGGVAVVLAGHSTAVAAIADRVVLLSDGQVVP
jgi:putative ABC transport system ATP-binding protein